MVETRHYSDYFFIPADYPAVMKREILEQDDNLWLEFNPHEKYVGFLKTILGQLDGGTKSVWLWGNFGTGKSFAALVTQKLFMDDEARVRQWFSKYRHTIPDSDALEKALFRCRSEGTLVAYDFNAQALGPHAEFLVRLERGVVAACESAGFTVPANANLEVIIDRLREEPYFFKTRDAIQGKLQYLNAKIKTVDNLIQALTESLRPSKGPEDPVDPQHLLDDVQTVLRERSIYLQPTSEKFAEWISGVVAKNGIKRIIYIFDEFSQFIEENSTNLKTFEDITLATKGLFYLVPVTHSSIDAYFAEKSSSAHKANDRFFFCDLQMPNDTAFKLAAGAMKPVQSPDMREEWEFEKSKLWGSIHTVANDSEFQGDVNPQSFHDMLPIHPMAAFVLKHLSVSAGSNQRSIFEYLQYSPDSHEFQDFINQGGPAVATKQLLTVDYLWKYFMERRNLGQNKELNSLRTEFDRIRSKEFSNKSEDDDEIRVLKTVMLFVLLDRLNPSGHERLRPTVRNIELSFVGDGQVVNVRGVLKSLEERHCFTIVNNNIELFATSVGGEDLQKEIAANENKFHDLISDKTAAMIEQHTKAARQGFAPGRFEIKVSDASHYITSNLTTGKKENCGPQGNQILLWFAIARNSKEQLQLPDKITNVIQQLRGHRVLGIAFPDLTFCDQNAELWKEYITQFSQYKLENDKAAKDQRKAAFEKLEAAWFTEVKKNNRRILIYKTGRNNELITVEIAWLQLKAYLGEYLKEVLTCCPDALVEQITAYDIRGLAGSATAGIQFDPAQAEKQHKQLVNIFKSQGVQVGGAWLAQNPQHPFAQMHELFVKKIRNTIGNGNNFSVRKAYIELQRPPFGLRLCALSAFVMGFALRDTLEKGYQWTNEQFTSSLDAEILASIIEDVVADDGGKGKNIKTERFLCRLSREERTFVDKAPLMFNALSGKSGTVEGALIAIQDRVQAVSGRVPLWMLPNYIASISAPQADIIREIIKNICLALGTSSKGKTEDRTNAVKEVGKLILEDDSIIQTFAGHFQSENFLKALRKYIDTAQPTLAILAESVGDCSQGYAKAVLEKARETAGWLWTPSDIAQPIQEVIAEYEIICILKPLLRAGAFIAYQDAVEGLKDAVIKTNKLPKQLIVACTPALTPFLSAVEGGSAVNQLRDVLTIHKDAIQFMFFDPSHTEQIACLKARLNNPSIADTDLHSIYNNGSNGYYTSESTYLDTIRSAIEIAIKNSVIIQFQSAWKTFCGEDTPAAWALSNGIPVRYLLGDAVEKFDILRAIESPKDYSPEKLQELKSKLDQLVPSAITDCQQRFLSDVIPKKYKQFNINLPSLLDYLRGKCGPQPNYWAPNPDVEPFIRAHYKGEFAPQVKQKLQNTPAEELKYRLLQLASENPDLGLLFWGEAL